jgi:hypothetical protein
LNKIEHTWTQRSENEVEDSESEKSNKSREDDLKQLHCCSFMIELERPGITGRGSASWRLIKMTDGIWVRYDYQLMISHALTQPRDTCTR